ncbi:MAG TPA: ATP-dependent sacrificial sulfur transferase LarE [bacterium]|nr:ATP-dependent sacrificial sulfur transferase LarE [bacterium]HOL34447.1 ATP-dependent sacrificial sulfur transferase LarE [bacterium]HPP08272.1 ATP-dependent sacrificial sulfur transferase LarE [bacterium]
MLRSEIEKKKRALEEILQEAGKILIAYSGGVDSTFLLKVAVDCLGKENVAAFIEKSELDVPSDINFAKKFAKSLGVKVFFLKSRKLTDKNLASNPPDRCFHCKKELFSQMTKIARKCHYSAIADGSNLDDISDYRPGNKAKSLYQVISPLQMANLTKSDIRVLSKEMGLPTWDKPPMACLASRIPYGENITQERLKRILKAEEHFVKLGFNIVRVRDYRNFCRIEVSDDDLEKIIQMRKKIVERLKKIGYMYITVDLEGYHTGSMNKTLPLKK